MTLRQEAKTTNDDDAPPNTDESSTTTTTTSGGEASDWVVENLESDNSTITTTSAVQAGENDTLPAGGLYIANLRILASEAHDDDDEADSATDNDHSTSTLLYPPIRLLVGRNGWGTGVHPTTRLCLEWLHDTIQGGERVLDYGTGSGILSIAALRYGAASCTGVDVEAEALVTATRNAALNGYDSGGRFEVCHVRQVEPYGLVPPADLVVANILVGQLVRPSMVAALVSNVAPGGFICFSGIRPDEVEAVQDAYRKSLDWIDTAELAAADTVGSLESYGFDVGTWARLVGRKRAAAHGNADDEIRFMSELAIQ